MNYNLLVILGPTASGKTKLGVQLAEILNGEIISADSRQVYRGMDIGTGKDLAEYGTIPYHLIDIIDPGFEFNVFRYQSLFVEAFESIKKRECKPILVGGTGMYLDSVLMGYHLQEVPRNAGLRNKLDSMSMEDLIIRFRNIRPHHHNNTDLVDRDRLIRAIEIAEHEIKIPSRLLPEIRPLVFGIRWERETLRRRITERLKYRLHNGMIEEVERLHNNGISFETLEFYGLEYRFLARYLKGELNRNDLFQKLNSAIHDFAKRQETWFRRMERNGTRINWLKGAGDPFKEALNTLNSSEKTIIQKNR